MEKIWYHSNRIMNKTENNPLLSESCMRKLIASLDEIETSLPRLLGQIESARFANEVDNNLVLFAISTYFQYLWTLSHQGLTLADKTNILLQRSRRVLAENGRLG